MRNTPQSHYEWFDITKYTPWINLLSKKNNIEIVIDTSFSHTAAINLENIHRPKIILNPKLMKEKFHYSDEEIIFDIGHELGHDEEESELQSTDEWKKVVQKRAERLKKRWNLTESYHTLENICRDVWVNNDLISPNKLPVLKDTCYTNYRDKMFKDKEYVDLPKHLQFVNTLIREAMVEDEICSIDPQVRKIITRLKRSGVLGQATTWPLKERLEAMREYIEPVYEKLLQEDIQKQDEKKQKEGKKEEGKEGNSNQENGDQNQQNNQTPWDQKDKQWKEEGKKNIIKQIKELFSWKKDTWEKWKQTNEIPEKKTEGNLVDNQSTVPEKTGADKNPFDDLYQNIPKVPHILESELSEEDREKLKQLMQDIYNNTHHREKTREELELENRVKNMGIDPSDKDTFQKEIERLKKYEEYLDQLKQVKDKNTGNTVMEEIEYMFERIRSHRAKPRYKAKWPVDIEHGNRLNPGAIARWMADVQAGNFNPEMFEMDIKHEKPEQLTGRFELTLIGDGSGSMEDDNKNKQQKIAISLILEALKRLHDKLAEERHNLTKWVEFTTQALMFMESMTGVLHCKNLWSDFTDTERLHTYDVLDHAAGWTNDFDGLQEIIDQMEGYSHEHLQDIQSGKVKKIVMVLSDWGSNDKKKMKEKIQILRSMGVLVYGIGITSSWKPVIDLFETRDKNLGYGQVCKQVEDLAQTLKNILWMHIEKL